jgi:hypothetical protein
MKRLFGSYLFAGLGLAAAVFGGMLWIGCDGKTNTVNPSGPDNAGKPLTLPSGYAWILDGDSLKGVIFTADGRVFDLYRYSVKSGWQRGREGTYKTADGIRVRLAYSESDTGTLLFGLSDGGDTLTLYTVSGTRPPSGYYGQTVYAKTPGVSVTIPPHNPGTGGNLVLGSKEAWINAAEGVGFIFWSDSTVSMIGGASGIWVLSDERRYKTKNGHILWSIRTPWGDESDVPYTVSGNSLVITWYDEAVAFAKTSNIVISPHAGGNLVLSQGQAWVHDETGVPGRGYGYIFDSTKISVIISDDGVWELAGTVTYTKRGSNLTVIRMDGDTSAAAYTVSGNVLIFTVDRQTIVLTKKSGISIANHIGGNLVLPSGQAWTRSNGDYETGYIFQAGGQVFMVNNYRGNWIVDIRGTYETSDVNITVTWDHGCWDGECHTYTQSGAYSVSGNSLTLVLSGGRENLAITSGVNIPADSLGLLKKPVAPAPEASARRLSAGGRPAPENKPRSGAEIFNRFFKK